MATKSGLMQAREELAVALDAKLSNDLQWQALRAIDRVLFAHEGERRPAPTNRERAWVRERIASAVGETLPSYVSLALKAIDEKKRPLTTPEVMEYIGSQRQLGNDLEKAKINVTSSLSKNSRIKSIIWEGGRAWWHADQPVPKKETAA